MSNQICDKRETNHGIVQYTQKWKLSNDTEHGKYMDASTFSFPHIFISIEDIIFIEQLAQTIDLSV